MKSRSRRGLYFKVSDQDAVRMVRTNDTVSIDYYKKDEIVGVEIIRVNRIKGILKEVLKDASFLLTHEPKMVTIVTKMG